MWKYTLWKYALAALLVGPTSLVLSSPAEAGPPYRSCAEARADGAAPLRRGDPGYSSKLDRDGDGVACETGGGSRSSPSGRGGSAPSAPIPAAPTPAPLLSTAPPATASPVSPASCSAPVLGAPCCNAERHIFGKDADGREFFCAYPDNAAATPLWKPMNATFIGVQEIGAPCSSQRNHVAETAIGVPLFCADADDVWKSVAG